MVYETINYADRRCFMPVFSTLVRNICVMRKIATSLLRLLLPSQAL